MYRSLSRPEVTSGWVLDLPSETANVMVGLEHEYEVRENGRQLDFRVLMHGLGVPGLRLDPGDSNAYRLSSGLALTADEREAEIATPPVVVRPGFTDELASWAAEGRRALSDLLSAEFTLAGYSTHLSVSVDGAAAEDLASLYARTFAPALMLLFDTPGGLGIYVRPRPGRLELCADYCAGVQLQAAAVFALGSVLACAAELETGRSILRAVPLVSLRPANGRFGYFVGRNSGFGFDLYRRPRLAVVRGDDGSEIQVQTYLAEAWHAARNALGGLASQDELALVDGIVAGSSPLGVEGSRQEAESLAVPVSSVHGEILPVVDRPAFSVIPVLATWAFTVFRIEAVRPVFACVPSENLPAFLSDLQSARLDGLIERYAASQVGERVLSTFEDVQRPALWDAVGPPQALLPSEYDPSGAPNSRESAKVVRQGKHSARIGKLPALPLSPPVDAHPWPQLPHAAPEPGQSDSPATLWPSMTAIAGAVIMFVVLIGLVGASVAGLFDGESQTPAAATPSPTAVASVSVTPTPSPRPTETAVSGVPSVTVAPAGVATEKPAETAAAPSVSPTATVAGALTPTATPTRALDATPTPTPRATETATGIPPSSTPPAPTATPTPACTPGPGVACPPTPTPTPTRTPPSGGPPIQ